MKKNTLLNIFLGIMALVLGTTIYSCQEDNFNTGSDVMLEFSLDTLTFDTVFTQVGSATRILKAYNRGNRPIEISEVYLEEGTSSKFRFNVDGYTVSSGDSSPPIPIAGNDSIYIFMEVTVDPDAPLSESPFVIYEHLNFETNGNIQQVILEAFGQNANYIPSKDSKGTANLLTCDMGIETWNDPKPYVIYGVLFVDSCEIVIPAGTQIYVHGGLINAGGGAFYNDGIWFFGADSKLNIQGTISNPVTIQGDRLEEEYDDVPGQWAGIRLGTTNNTHEIRNVVIKNSIVGLRVDSLTTAVLENVEIRNTANTGLLGVHANIDAENCLFVDNGGNSVQLEFGGNYDLRHCTLANFGSDQAALRTTNFACYGDDCEICLGNEMNASLSNCIITGTRSDEVSLGDGECTSEALNVSFQNCILKVNELLEKYPNFYTDNCLSSSCVTCDDNDALFLDYPDGDYHLDTLSCAKDRGIMIGILDDIEGTSRDGNPDLGCYESGF